MTDDRYDRPGPTHPVTGARMVIDEAQEPEALIDRHRKRAMIPAAAERYAEAVRQKVAAHGLIYVDPVSGYRMRWKPE